MKTRNRSPFSRLTRPGFIFVIGLALALAAFAPATRGQDGFEQRRGHYLMSLPDDAPGAFGAVARLKTGRAADLPAIQPDLDHIARRKDCSDFIMAGVLRLLYLYGNDPGLDPAIKAALRESVLNFKYWIDEPGTDSMCYWSENHQVLYHSAEYLAGALYPDETFTNSGMTGREHMEKGKRLLERWFGWREEFGFSEWLSNVYYEEDTYPLLNLVDFAPDEAVRKRAAMTLDQLALNMALNNFQGNFTCTHGRSYTENVLSPAGDDTKQIFYLLWGRREFTPDLARVNKAGIALATTNYRLPRALELIGNDQSPEMENWQSHGLAAEDGAAHGLPYNDLNNLGAGMFYWGQGMYTHPLVVDLSASMWKQYRLEKNAFFLGLVKPGQWLSTRGKLDDMFARLEVASEGAILADSYTYTYRTPDYILSTCLDRRPGLVDAQGTIWQAGLGGDATVFTTYPGRLIVGWSPEYWAGNGSDPRAAQTKNVMVAIYHAPARVSLGEAYRYNYSHAWFPKDAFDEVVERDGWVFGRRGRGYVALFSFAPARFKTAGKYAGKEIVAWGRKNVWICEMGREEVNGSFADFITAVATAEVVWDPANLAIAYHSPTRGRIEFSWTGPFLVDGAEVPLHRQVRYDNPFVRAERFSKRLEITHGPDNLVLDFNEISRIIRP